MVSGLLNYLLRFHSYKMTPAWDLYSIVSYVGDVILLHMTAEILACYHHTSNSSLNVPGTFKRTWRTLVLTFSTGKKV